MKKTLTILTMLGLCLTANASDIETSKQKFEVTVTIVYNTVTLREAADIEVALKKTAHNACKVNLTAKALPPNNITSVGSISNIRSVQIGSNFTR
jgi:hypothetical protein